MQALFIFRGSIKNPYSVPTLQKLAHVRQSCITLRSHYGHAKSLNRTPCRYGDRPSRYYVNCSSRPGGVRSCKHEPTTLTDLAREIRRSPSGVSSFRSERTKSVMMACVRGLRGYALGTAIPHKRASHFLRISAKVNVLMKDSTLPTTKIIPPATSPTPSTVPSPNPNLDRWRKEMDEDRKRIETADLSKVKVW